MGAQPSRAPAAQGSFNVQASTFKNLWNYFRVQVQFFKVTAIPLKVTDFDSAKNIRSGHFTVDSFC
ncbi:MAG: hypothetical protein AN484_27220 [Aphanizomenon flos-aquae WA102]|uniref:Uncharacterized protein n=1 Tax=Aphanizomenon flos-aquae WA102 TaxID=1710896 RepID=A0A1B7W884_APHFL|nr:MAG: hypothetical protein AN484_27220 [Aphanizomenon flos-aquae WA102]